MDTALFTKCHECPRNVFYKRKKEKKRKISNECNEQCAEKRAKEKTRIAHNRQIETPEKRTERLAGKKTFMMKQRQTETPEKRTKRLSKINMSMTRTREVRSTIPAKSEIVNFFLEKVKDACDYICSSCHRMMYRITVRRLDDTQYVKAPTKIVNNVLRYRLKSGNGKEWICRTCHNCLKRGKMPAQSKANMFLSLPQQPV